MGARGSRAQARRDLARSLLALALIGVWAATLVQAGHLTAFQIVALSLVLPALFVCGRDALRAVRRLRERP